jgi:hypothetical protein
MGEDNKIANACCYKLLTNNNSNSPPSQPFLQEKVSRKLGYVINGFILIIIERSLLPLFKIESQYPLFRHPRERGDPGGS